MPGYIFVSHFLKFIILYEACTMTQHKHLDMLMFVSLLFLQFVKGDDSSLNCTFDDDLCSWVQDDSENFDWARHTEQESYIYIESSHYFYQEGLNARIISSKHSPGRFCLTILYKIYVKYLGSLNVYMRADGERDELIFTKENDAGNPSWQSAVIGDISYAAFQIIIEGVIVDGIRGSGIAIDDISMTDRFCSTVSSCNFDSGLCNWVQDSNDNFDWTLPRGNTYSSRGPSADYTSGIAGGRCIYIETNTTLINVTARLISPLIASGKYCFSFWYLVHGKDTSTLTVNKADKQKTTIEKLVNFGNQEENWRKETVFIQSETYFKVIIEGRVKDVISSFQGYIAVDDVDITSCQDCENPQTSNRKTNSSNFQYSSAIEIRCNTGYHLTGPSTLICQPGGMWSANSTCEPIYCENPQPINGRTNSSNFRYGSAIQVMCHSGFYLTGPPIITCQSGGTWSATVTCDPIECNDPSPNNGLLNSTFFGYGSTVEIKCNDGYKISGESVIYCQANGSWTAYPSCLHIDCLMPMIANGRISGPRTNTTYNHTVDIACEDSFDLVGNKSITCEADGNWSTYPICDFDGKENTRDLTVVFFLIPLVAIAVGITILAIILRKKMIHYFTNKSVQGHNKEEQPQPGIMFSNFTYSDSFFEKQSYQEDYLAQIDAYAEIAFDMHETGQGESPGYSTVAEAGITTIKEIEDTYDHTSQPGTPVIDNTYSQLSRNKGMSSSIYSTTTFSLSGNPSFQSCTNRKSKIYDMLNTKKARESCRFDSQRNMQDEQDCEYDHVQARGTVPTYISDYEHLNVVAENSKHRLKYGRLNND